MKKGKKEYLNERHGMTYSSEFTSYHGMKQRCCNPKNRGYYLYGGRGITVCTRWLEGFQNFIDDMGAKPTPQHSIDRIDVNGNYEPGNCQWATKQEQIINRRCTRLHVVDGISDTVNGHCKRLGMDHATVSARVKRGIPLEIALKTKESMRVAPVCNRSSANAKGLRGVVLAKRKSKRGYEVRIYVNKKNQHVGIYDTKKEAAQAYNEAAKFHFGDKAYLNNIESIIEECEERTA